MAGPFPTALVWTDHGWQAPKDPAEETTQQLWTDQGWVFQTSATRLTPHATAEIGTIEGWHPEPTDGPPVILSVTPPLGDVGGGIPIQILGVNFTGATSVTINSVPVLSFTVVSDGIIEALTPALVAGQYTVLVTTPGGVASLPLAYESYYPTEIVGLRVYDSELGVTQALGLVTAWNDQGAGVKNLGAAAAQRPTYTAARFGIEGSRSGLVFDGILNEMLLVAPESFAAHTVFAVVKWEGIPVADTAEVVTGPGIGPTDAGIHDLGLNTTGGLYTMRTFDADTAIDYRSPTDPTNFLYRGSPIIVGLTHDGAGAGPLDLFLYGTPQGVTQFDPYVIARASWDRIGNGSANPLAGEIGAVVVAEAILTAIDIERVVTWMWGKWISRTYRMQIVKENPAWFARDGQGLLTIDDGASIILPGGWNSQGPGQFPIFPENVTNEVWRTLDKGVTWVQILPDANDPNRFSQRHVPGGWLVHDGHYYVIGSDSYNGPQNNFGTGVGTQDVWRSSDGVNWQLMTNAAQWPVRTLHGCASYKGALWVMGGQTNQADPNSVLNDVWRSTDGGVNWVQQANAPWIARGVWGSSFPTHDGSLWVIGGGRYDAAGAAAVWYNDVWRFDGTVWTQVIADGAAPFARRSYHQVQAFDDRLFIMNGVQGPNPGSNLRDMWTSDFTGAIWTQQTIPPWVASHADASCVLSDRIVLAMGNGDIGQPIDPGVAHVFQIFKTGFLQP